MSGPPRRSIEDRFWPKVDRRGPDECWLWTGAREGGGYGYLGRTLPSAKGPEVPKRLAHRVSYEIHYGLAPEDLCVCHSCDVRLCVNPSHLFLGTRADNNEDRDRKGRGADRHGERNPNAKLTPGQVAEIRGRYVPGVTSQQSLADEYGVKQPQISRIVRGVEYLTPGVRVDDKGSDRRGHAKLTPGQVAEIRARHAREPILQQALADEYGVTQAQISRIVRGVSYL